MKSRPALTEAQLLGIALIHEIVGVFMVTEGEGWVVFSGLLMIVLWMGIVGAVWLSRPGDSVTPTEPVQTVDQPAIVIPRHAPKPVYSSLPIRGQG